MEIASICYSIIIPAVDSRDVEVNFLLWLISSMYKNLMTIKTPIDLSPSFNNDQSIANLLITHSSTQIHSFPLTSLVYCKAKPKHCVISSITI